MDACIEHNALMAHIKITLYAIVVFGLFASANSFSHLIQIPAKENAAVNTTSPVPDHASETGFFRPHTPDEFPGLTPEEVGRRFLNLAASLKSFGDFTEERVREVMQLPFQNLVTGLGFRVYDEKSGWFYGFEYVNIVSNLHHGFSLKRAEYSFYNGEDNHTDMPKICQDTSAYISTLKKMGFKRQPKKARWLTVSGDFVYARKYVQVKINELRQSRTPAGKPRRRCIELITISTN